MPGRATKIQVDEARKLLENPDIVLLDVRQPEEYRAGHIPGATLLPLPDLPDKMDSLNASKNIVTYCRVGRRSLAAAQLIADEKGIEVFTIDGGITAWNGLIAMGDVEEGLYIAKNLENPKDLISLAYALEDGAGAFYLRLSEFFEYRAGAFKELYSAEVSHKLKIEKNWPDVEIDDRFRDYMEGGARISAVIEKIVSENMGLRDALEYSMQLEVNSLDFYMRVLKTADKDAAAIFKMLIDEEKRHLQKLGELLSMEGQIDQQASTRPEIDR